MAIDTIVTDLEAEYLNIQTAIKAEKDRRLSKLFSNSNVAIFCGINFCG